MFMDVHVKILFFFLKHYDCNGYKILLQKIYCYLVITNDLLYEKSLNIRSILL